MPIHAKLCEKCQVGLQSSHFWEKDYVPLGKARGCDLRSIEELDVSSSAGCPTCRWLLARILTLRKEVRVVDLEWWCFYSNSDIEIVIFQFGHKDRIGAHLSILAMSITPFLRAMDAEWNVGDLLPYTGSSKTLALAEEWVKNCVSSHVLCDSSRSSDWRPSRLIKVNSTEKGEISASLHESCLDQFDYGVEYLALSHRWIQNEPIRLSLDNNESLRQSIPMDQLKASIIHAMQIAARFSIPYVWIDLLCIIQDDALDRNREIPQMDRIYTNAYCTIAAVDAETSEEGCFFVRDPLQLSIFAIQLDADIQQKDFLIRLEWNHEDLDHAPLARRGWFFQERFLSPRMIYYTKKQMHWECRELAASEMYPEGTQHDPSRNTQKLSFRSAGDVLKYTYKSTGERNQWSMRIWNDVLFAYNDMALTFQEDRLNAILGVTNFCKDVFQDECTAGIWRKHMPVALFWHVETLKGDMPPTRIPPTVAPSWSWASVVNGRRGPYVMAFSALAYYATIVRISEAKDWCPSVGDGPISSTFGTRPPLTIHLRGTLVEATIDLSRERDSLLMSFPVDPKIQKIHFFRDTAELLPLQVMLLPLLADERKGGSGVQDSHGLVVLPTSGGMHRRVGYFWHRGLPYSTSELDRQDIILC